MVLVLLFQLLICVSILNSFEDWTILLSDITELNNITEWYYRIDILAKQLD